MNNHTIGRMKVVAALTAFALLLVMAVPATAQGGPRRNGPGAGPGDGSGSGIVTSTQPLTAEETAWLTYMREEEKLAGDVYEQLGQKWNLRIFAAIAQSEDRHAAAVARVMAHHGVPDPAENLPAGVYVDADLTSLYHALMEKGTRSLQDALEVGVLIEQTDIADLEVALSTTDKLDLKRLFNNLMEGSLNHLEAFETTLDAVCMATAPAN